MKCCYEYIIGWEIETTGWARRQKEVGTGTILTAAPLPILLNEDVFSGLVT